MFAGERKALNKACCNFLAAQKSAFGIRHEVTHGEDIRFRPFQDHLFQDAFRTRVAVEPLMDQRYLHG